MPQILHNTSRLTTCSAHKAPNATSFPGQTTAKRVHGTCSAAHLLRTLQVWPRNGRCWMRKRGKWAVRRVCSKRRCRYDVILCRRRLHGAVGGDGKSHHRILLFPVFCCCFSRGPDSCVTEGFWKHRKVEDMHRESAWVLRACEHQAQMTCAHVMSNVVQLTATNFAPALRTEIEHVNSGKRQGWAMRLAALCRSDASIPLQAWAWMRGQSLCG